MTLHCRWKVRWRKFGPYNFVFREQRRACAVGDRSDRQRGLNCNVLRIINDARKSQDVGIPGSAKLHTRQRTRCRQTARRRREVAQIFQQSPADDRLRCPHPVPRTVPTCAGGSGASSLSLADALCHRLRRGFRRSRSSFTLGKAAFEIVGLNVKSPTVPERTAPGRCYFFFFAATLRFAGAFFFAAVFAFVAFFTMLPS